MRWPWSRRPKPRLVDPFIDMERDSNPTGSEPDPMLLMFDLAHYGTVVVATDEETGHWAVVVGDMRWTRPTQMEALLAAREQLGAEEWVPPTDDGSDPARGHP